MANLSEIRRDMQVVSSDGEVIGHVASADTGLSVTPTGGAGGPHAVPDDWIARVDQHVHLRHSAAVLRGRWTGTDGARPHQQQGKAKLPWLIGLVLLAILLALLVWSFVYSADDSKGTNEPLPSTGQEFSNTAG